MITSVLPSHSITYDGTILNVYHANKGEGLPKHQHTYAHLTMVHSGVLLVTKEGKSLKMTKYTQPVNLLPDGWHELEALEDDTVFVNVFTEGKS